MSSCNISILLSSGLLFLTTACGSKSEIGGGFELVDGGGSKTSLAKDGRILINYTVTGIGKINGYVIIEDRPYGSPSCRHYIIDNARRQLRRLRASGPSTESLRELELLRSVKSINSRSCSNSVDADPRGAMRN